MIFLVCDVAGRTCSLTVNVTDFVANRSPDVDKFSDKGFSYFYIFYNKLLRNHFIKESYFVLLNSSSE